jgi:peptidoglycan/xylan/chitin deacetylase (PgdA/CDA1 family)
MGRILTLGAIAVLAIAAIAAHAQQASVPPMPAPQVAFTFDDLPAHGPMPPGETRRKIIDSILATLKQEKMPPVYGFVNGNKVAKYPFQMRVLEDWVKAGEPLGNHTWSHPSLEKESAGQYIADIAKDEAVLKSVDRKGDWHWFRYPFLNEGETLEKRQQVRDWLTAHGYRIAEVTLDFEDYMWNDPYARCMAKQKAGTDEKENLAWLEQSYLDVAAEFTRAFRALTPKLYGHEIPYVLLLHCGAFDAKMLPRLIAQFRSEGFTFVTLQQAESDAAYSIDPKIGYPNGGTLEELMSKVKGVNFPDNTKPYKKIDEMCR